jgi:hypothetical protein
LGTQSSPNRRFAAAMYMAMMYGAGPLIVMETLVLSLVRSKPS